MLSSGVFLQRCICEHVRVSCVDDVCYAPVFTENEKAQKKESSVFHRRNNRRKHERKFCYILLHDVCTGRALVIKRK